MNGRMLWGTGDQNGSYLEIREEGRKLAFSADITVRGSLALGYRVWFVNGPILKVDAAGDSSTVGGRKGLFAGDTGARFYGEFFNSGGQNPSRVEARIIVERGSEISRSFVEAGGNGFIGGPAGIANKGDNSSPVEYGRDSIRGYLNWDIR
jgi:hypothetical protein